jgi:predicted transcriptional regulator
MPSRITIDLSDDVRFLLDEATRKTGISADEIVKEALRRYLFVQRFREFRDQTVAQVRLSGHRGLADEDVFRAISKDAR